MFAASKSARSAAAGDNKFNYVTLLLNGDGTNGKQNNTFLDSSSNAFTITRNGTPTQGSFSPYGSLWSNYFNGSSDSLTVTSNVANFGTGDFTVEAWVYLTGSGGGYPQLISAKNAVGPQFGFVGTTQVTFYDGTTGYTYSTGSSANQWAHVAFVRSSGTFKIYVNGVQVGSFTYTGAINLNSTMIGAYNNGTANGYFQGYISNLRVVNGTAVYTGAFTPSTTPLTAITNTSLLTCQSNRFRDASSNNFTITSSGTPSVQRFSPFEPSTSYTSAVNGGSGYFNGSTDWLSTTNSSALQLNNTTAFTLECWLYPTLANTRMFIFNNYNQASPYTGYALAIGGAGPGNYEIQFWDGTTWRYFGVLPSNTWSHVAVCYQGSGTTGMFFVNGVQIGASFAVSSSINYTSGSALIGAQAASTNLFSGYITDLRLVKGTALYTAAFTPPTAPLTAVTNTSLLLNYTNAGISDAAAANDLTTVGNAQVSTSVVKYGTGSMAFNGTNSIVQNNGSTLPFTFGTGDFTVECWVYLNTLGVTNFVYDSRATSEGLKPLFFVSNANKLSYYISGTTVITGTTSLTSGTWYHIALCRSGTSTKIFLNGTQEGSTYTDSNNYICEANRPVLGVSGFTYGTNYFSGYIDDLRVTKGYARYTANFTAPTAALPTF